MSSSYSTIELQYNLDIQCVQKILTHFSIIEGKLQKDEINAIQTYNCPNLQV